MLAGGVAVLFVGQHLQGLDDAEAGAHGLDHVIDVALLGRREGSGEEVGVALLELRGLGGHILGGVQLLLVDDLYGAIGAHHGDLGSGPGVVHIAPQMLGAHHTIGAAVGLAQDHGHLGHGGLGEGEEQLGAVADDAAVLLAGAGHEAGHILQGEEGNVEAVAEAHEASALDAGVVVEHSGHDLGLVGHDAHGAAIESGEAHHQVGGEGLVDLQEVAIIHQGVDHVLHVVGLVGALRQHGVQLGGGPIHGIGAGHEGGLLLVVLGQEGEQAAGVGDGLFLVGGHEVGHTALGGVDAGAAELLGGDILPGHLLHHLGAREEHVAVALGHGDEIRDGGTVHRAAGAGPQDQADLGHHAAGEHVTQEDIGVTRQGVHALLDAGAAAIVEPDHRRADLYGQIHDLADLLGEGLGEAAAEDGEILTEHEH